jgi:outer membrane lipoprotein-sorting protein
LVPVIVAGAVVVGTAIESSGASGVTPKLAPRTTGALLTAVRTSAATALSGKVTETSNFGLPDLPGGQSRASLSWQGFITGSHSLRVWVDGLAKQRIAVIGELSEADVVHNGRDIWTYTSESNTVSHTVLPKRAHERTGQTHHATADSLTPAAATQRVLKAIRPSTSVTLGANRMVAGHSAYTLQIAPRDHRSTIRQITIAIDSKHFVPLELQVFGASSSPAFQVGFDQISFRTPGASTFDFHAPAGATVSSNPFAGDRQEQRATAAPSNGPRAGNPAVRPRVIGTGWTSVLEIHDAGAAGNAAGLLDQLTTTIGTSGARLLHTALLNAVLLPDGRAFLGAVRPATLEHIASTTSG